MLIVSRFQPLTQLFFILDSPESARRNYCMMIAPQDFFMAMVLNLCPYKYMLLLGCVCNLVRFIFDCPIG